jgi:hypothetical protein
MGIYSPSSCLFLLSCGDHGTRRQPLFHFCGGSDAGRSTNDAAKRVSAEGPSVPTKYLGKEDYFLLLLLPFCVWFSCKLGGGAIDGTFFFSRCSLLSFERHLHPGTSKIMMDSPGGSTATSVGSSSTSRKNKPTNKTKKPTTFRPFVNATTETPLVHMILEPMLGCGGSSIISAMYRCRWFLSTPLRINLVPKWLMVRSIDLCGGWTIQMPTLTIGEVLLAVLPLLLLTLQGYHSSIMVPNTNTSGDWASFIEFIGLVGHDITHLHLLPIHR